jgi:hypothetical protein
MLESALVGPRTGRQHSFLVPRRTECRVSLLRDDRGSSNHLETIQRIVITYDYEYGLLFFRLMATPQASSEQI